MTTHEVIHRLALECDVGGAYLDSVCSHYVLGARFVAVLREHTMSRSSMYRTHSMPETGSEYLYELFPCIVALLLVHCASASKPRPNLQ